MQLTRLYSGAPSALRYSAPGVLPSGAGLLVLRNDSGAGQVVTLSTNKGDAQFVRGYGIINTATPLQLTVAANSTAALPLDDVTQYLRGVVTLAGAVQAAVVLIANTAYKGGAFGDGILQQTAILTASEVLQCQ